MRKHLFIFLCVAAFLATSTAICRAEEIGWPEAIGRLAREKTKATACASAFKSYAPKKQIASGTLSYDAARADYDQVISELIVAVSEGGRPAALEDLQANLDRGISHLTTFCKMADAVLPRAAGQKGIVDEAIKAAIEPVIGAIKDGVAALYNNHRKDDELTRETIKNELVAAKWPHFKDVERE